MSGTSEKLAEFTDKWGDEREIHRTRHGLRVRRDHATPILALNPVISAAIGARVRTLREAQGMTLRALALKCGMHSGHPKERMWAIENASRGEGMRLGTLHVLAMAVGVEAWDLMPSTQEVAAQAGVREIDTPMIGLSA